MPDDVLSGREALEKAFAEVSLRDEPDVVEEAVAEAPEAEAPSEDTRARDELGRFAPKEAETAPEMPVEAAPLDAAPPQPDATPPAPTGFVASAQADWAKTPASVRADVHRRFWEFEKGLSEYRQRFEAIRPYEERARASGTTLEAALQQYTSIEAELGNNPLQGLDSICRNLGTDLRSVAAHVMGQPAPEKDAQVEQMRSQMHAMQQELQGYRATQHRTITKQVTDFAATHPRFEELTDEIAAILNAGLAKDLPGAYEKADRWNPLPATAQTGAATPATAQTGAVAPRGPVSIKGAPSSGSNPERATESLSSREAVAKAFANMR